MLFPEFTAGEILVRFCRSALQARIAAESRACSKNFCNDRVYSAACHQAGIIYPSLFPPLSGNEHFYTLYPFFGKQVLIQVNAVSLPVSSDHHHCPALLLRSLGDRNNSGYHGIRIGIM
jgi:hypothetical protein